MNAGKRIEVLRPFVEFFSTLGIGLVVFGAIGPLIKSIGYPSLEKYNDLLPLHRYTATVTNSIFLYLAGCITIFTSGIIYHGLVLNRFRDLRQRLGSLTQRLYRRNSCWASWELQTGHKPGSAVKTDSRDSLSYFPCFYRFADLIIFVVLIILVFKNETAYFDYSAFLGAVNDVMLGKDILANVVVSYGFFNVYFVAGVFDLFKVRDYYMGLSLIVSVLYLLGYGGIYMFLRSYSRNLFLSVAFLFVILYIDFYCLHIPIHWTPQSTFLRFGSYLPVFLLLFLLEKKGGRRWEWLFAVSTATLCFWVIEYGVYLLVALTGVAICCYVFNFESRAHKWLYRIPRIFAVIVAIVIFLTIRIWLQYGHAPVWSDLFYFQKLYTQSGLAMSPLNSLGMWLIPVFIYAAAVYFCLRYYSNIRYADVWLFLSFFGLQSFLYFVGKGGGFVLARVVIPATILAAVFLSRVVQNDLRLNIAGKSLCVKYFVYALMTAICLVLSSTIKKEGKNASLLSLIRQNPKALIASTRQPSLKKFLKKEGSFKRFTFDVTMIQRLVGAHESLAILSRNDTLYYLSTRRKSLFNNAFYPHFLTHTQISEMADTILNSDNRYLFMDNSSFQVYDNLVTKHNAKVFSLVNKNFVKRASLGFLNVYERIPPPAQEKNR